MNQKVKVVVGFIIGLGLTGIIFMYSAQEKQQTRMCNDCVPRVPLTNLEEQ